MVSCFPLSRELSAKMNGTAFSTHFVGDGYRAAVPPKHLRQHVGIDDPRVQRNGGPCRAAALRRAPWSGLRSPIWRRK